MPRASVANPESIVKPVFRHCAKRGLFAFRRFVNGYPKNRPLVPTTAYRNPGALAV